MESLQALFGRVLKPLRTILRLITTTSGKVLGGTIETTAETPEGDLLSVEAKILGAHDCGCTLENDHGGICTCSRNACNHCFDHCSLCRQPLCELCSAYIEVPNGTARVCKNCVRPVTKELEQQTTTQRFKKFTKLFVEWEEQE